MKTCTYCGENKSLDLFYKRGGKPRSECKVCTNTQNRNTVTRDAVLKSKSRYRKKNRQSLRLKNSEYKKANRGRHNAQWMKYYATKLSATPVWLTEVHYEDIKAMYLLAKKFEDIFGVAYHVDHIVPLQGKNVCGLHVPWNLQLLPASINLSKNNQYNDFK